MNKKRFLLVLIVVGIVGLLCADVQSPVPVLVGLALGAILEE